MAFRDSTTASGSSDTPSVAVPAGVAIDDIVILYATMDAAVAVVDAGDWPTGFTELVEQDTTTDGQTFALGWKRLTAADSGSYTFGAWGSGGTPAWLCQAVAFSGRHTTDPPVATVTNVNTGEANPVDVDPPSVVAVAGDDFLIVSAPDVDASGIGNLHTPPTNYTEREDAENTWTNLACATRENLGAGAEDPGVFSFAITSGLAGWCTVTVRIPSSAVAAVTLPQLERMTRGLERGMNYGI